MIDLVCSTKDPTPKSNKQRNFFPFANWRDRALTVLVVIETGEIAMHPALKPEPFSPTVTPIDGQAYAAARELERQLQMALRGEGDIRRPGRPGQSRRGLLLTRALLHTRKLMGSLAPLAGIGEI
jgi:hypothetical protein